MAASQMQSTQLVERLMSSEVQVQLPEECKDVPAKLTASEVEKVFTDHVAGVRKFLFRQQPGQHVLKFVQMAYKDGWTAFRGTPLQDHLKWLLRSIVHYGYEEKTGASQYLSMVAEAFMDCQAVQARVVERVGLQIQGVTTDFRGLVTALIGEYKTMALKMLAAERLAQGKAYDDATPTHYENRLTADLGHQLGLNASDVRRASLDGHAHSRFAKLQGSEAQAAVVRAQELFDLDALLQAFVSELNSFGPTSSPESLSRLFLDWASDNMSEKHIVFDELTYTNINVDRTLALGVLEKLFLGELVDSGAEFFREYRLRDIFTPPLETTNSTNCDSLTCVEQSSATTSKTGIGATSGLASLAGLISFWAVFDTVFNSFFSRLPSVGFSVKSSV